MADWYSIKLFGSNTKQSTFFPDKTTVEALGDLVTVDAEISGTFVDMDAVGEVIEYNDNYVEGITKVRMKYTVRFKPKIIGPAAVSNRAFFNTDLIAKKYKWIWFNNLLLRPDDPTTPGTPLVNTKVMEFAITGFGVEPSETGNPYKNIIWYIKEQETT